jgi:hypothetical protein
MATNNQRSAMPHIIPGIISFIMVHLVAGFRMNLDILSGSKAWLRQLMPRSRRGTAIAANLTMSRTETATTPFLHLTCESRVSCT